MNTLNDALEWATELVDGVDDRLLLRSNDGELLKFLIATGRNNYYFVAKVDDDGSYLGCQVESRKARAGENWLRGRDLPDGKLTKETWDSIVLAMLRYEFVPIPPKIRQTAIPSSAVS